MAGSWEIANQNRVLVCTLTRELVTTTWAMNFRNLQIPGTYTFVSGMPFDHARNTGCQKVLELGWEWLFFLDDDLLVPPDTIYRLMAHKLPIVSGLYYRRASPLVPVMLREKEDKSGYDWITQYQDNALVECDLVGSGCLLIHRDTLLNMPPVSKDCRWFEWRCDKPDLPANERTSEDFTYIRHLRKNGMKVYCDTSVKCRHVGFSESFGGQLKPLELKL
jgi:glycosyltransferase involved in cell wall biosynthesis